MSQPMDREQINITFREDELQDVKELLDEVHGLIDPDMDLSRLLSTVHDKAVVAVRSGSILHRPPGVGLLHIRSPVRSTWLWSYTSHR